MITDTQKPGQTASTLNDRPPVVVVMGHVDHGKTTLLDAIRKTTVAEKETGGITQSIGAYEVARDSKKITFIDTPGHEAFFAMRSHGVKVADVALLVVAADDGVRAQTEEVIKHILEAQVPFIVVINKIDKPGAVIEKVKKDLADRGVLVEEWGGKVPLALVSARDGKGIEELLDLVLLVAELEELKYNPLARGEGYVIESQLDPHRGVMATIVVTNGTLKPGDVVVCGTASGSVKLMEDDTGRVVGEAWPAKPVRVMGLSELPMVGEACRVVADIEEAAGAVEEHKRKHADSLAGLKIEPAGQAKVLPIVVKAVALGPLEAVVGVLKQIRSDKVGLKLLRAGVGDVIQSDIKQAETVGARVVGFRVRVAKEILAYAEQRGVEIKIFDVIYDLAEGIRGFMARMLEPELIKNEIGRVEILAIFRTERSRMIVGGRVFSGGLKKGLKFELERGGNAVGGGKVVGLQREKEPVEEARDGSEVGLEVESGVVIEVGDVLVAYEEEKKYPEL